MGRKWELLPGQKEWLKVCIRASKSEKVGVILLLGKKVGAVAWKERVVKDVRSRVKI